jgi:hypothetical protein
MEGLSKKSSQAAFDGPITGRFRTMLTSLVRKRHLRLPAHDLALLGDTGKGILRAAQRFGARSPNFRLATMASSGRRPAGRKPLSGIFNGI